MLINIIFLLLLIVSLSINVGLMWFAWKSVKQIAAYDEELVSLIDIIKNFSTHLNSVHELEMYYGDETLRHLMRHAGEIINIFDTYDLLLKEEEYAEEDN
jgi:hypothetical protein|tara:strand:- start:282 stop:581 length:300 start_codon:yes stop_codon:yes gene_type:complete